MSVLATTTVAVEMTNQELSLLLCTLITAPAGVADQLLIRLADAYHRTRKDGMAAEATELVYSAYDSRGGAGGARYVSYAVASLISVE